MNLKNDRALKAQISGFVNLLADKADELEKRAQTYRDEAEFKAEHGEWYAQFRGAIKAAMSISEELLELQEELADPEYARIHRQVVAEWDRHESGASAATAEREMPAPEPDWVRQRPPGPPESCGNPERDQTFRGVHEALARQHQEFLRETREKLRTRRGLRPHFVQTMRDLGLEAVLVEYFHPREGDF